MAAAGGGQAKSGPRRQLAAERHNRVEPPSHPGARQRRIGHKRQAFAREVVHHAQDAKPPTAAQRIGDKVQRPALVRPLRQRHRRPGAQCPFATTAAADLQPFLTVDPQQLLVVRHQAFPRQQVAQTPTPKPPPPDRQFSQPLPQVSIVRPVRLISRDPPGNADQITRPTLAQPVTLPSMGDCAPLRAWRHQFLSGCPSEPQCPASPPPEASSAWRSPLPGSEAVWPRSPQAHRTSPSTCRRSRRLSRVGGKHLIAVASRPARLACRSAGFRCRLLEWLGSQHRGTLLRSLP